jgi:hypothetical protein
VVEEGTQTAGRRSHIQQQLDNLGRFEECAVAANLGPAPIGHPGPQRLSVGPDDAWALGEFAFKNELKNFKFRDLRIKFLNFLCALSGEYFPSFGYWKSKK